jgi:hypothetical protein
MEEAWKAVKKVCKDDLGLDPKRYFIFKETGGFDWVLEKIASDFFMSMKPIDTIVRYRMACLRIAYLCRDIVGLFDLNEQQKKEKKDSWEWGSLEKRIQKCRKDYEEKVKKLNNRW